ncbi:MAG: Transposase, Mutator family [Verrucomicrobia bacterium]|nr:MAG: Transposase, Mutator family [Verrucomicrobiota bacterium]
MGAGAGILAKQQQQTATVTTANPDILSFSVEKAATEVCRSQLERGLREGAIRLLIDALECEIADFIEEHRDLRDRGGRQAVVRNGHARTRTIQTGLGPVEVQVPRARDRNKALKFTSKILTPYPASLKLSLLRLAQGHSCCVPLEFPDSRYVGIPLSLESFARLAGSAIWRRLAT